MQIQEAAEHIGNLVIASDEFWGTYTGILVDIENTRVGFIGNVKIIKNIVEPCQHSVFYPNHRYDRIPYEKDSIKSFKLENIERDDIMSPILQKLVGQAIVQLISGNRKKAAELSVKANKVWYREHHLHASIDEILDYKNKRRKLA